MVETGLSGVGMVVGDDVGAGGAAGGGAGKRHPMETSSAIIMTKIAMNPFVMQYHVQFLSKCLLEEPSLIRSPGPMVRLIPYDRGLRAPV